MRKYNKLLVLLLVIILILLTSMVMYNYGITDKIKGNVDNLSVKNKEDYYGKLPIITSVINSSGEKLVNTNIAIIVNAESNININKVLYSYNEKKWYSVKGKYNKKKITSKILFKKTINRKIYIKVIDENGNSSYSYTTMIKIDKKKPSLKIITNADNYIINAKDNILISTIQYSKDKVLWEDENVKKKEINISKKYDDYKYIRVVDSVGNISNVRKIK